MSFYTSFNLVRPCKPPIVRGPELAALISELVRLEVFDSPPHLPLKLKFGRAIDQDVKDTSVYVQVYPGVFNIRDIEWDVKTTPRSLTETIAELAKHDKPIYRASVDLGTMPEHLRAHLNNTEGKRETPNLFLGSWWVGIEPTRAYLLGEERSYVVGWMSLSASGNGHMFPLKLCELVERARSNAQLRAVADLARKTWPVTDTSVSTPLWWRFPSRLQRYAFDMQGGLPSRRVRRIRTEMGSLWPYPIDAPFDWFWTVNESG